MIQEKDKYRLLIENLPDGLAYCKMVRDNTGKPVDYIFLEVNSSFETLSGLPRDHIIGKKVTELYPGIKGLGFDWIGVFDQVAAIGTGQSIRFQQYLDQQGRWYEITAYSDQPGYFAVIFHDITQHKQAEEKSFETKEYLEKLIKYANAPIIVWDTLLSITRFNKAFENLSGYDASEVIGKKINILFSKNKIESVLKHIQKTSSGERWEAAEIEIQRKDGEPRIVLWNSANILDTERNNVIATIAQGQDITERKQVEEALRISEARYRLLVENANETILVAQDGMLKFVNQMTVELFGYSEQELTSRPFPEFVHPDDRGMVVERHIRRLKGDVFQPRYAFRLVTRDGSIKWVEIGAVLIDWEGRPATLNFITDITERKQANIEMNRQREILQKIFDHIPVMITYFDKNGKITMTNHELIRVLGWTSEEWKTENILVKCYPEPEVFKEVLDFMGSGKIGWKDFRTATKYGTIIDTAWTNIFLSDGVSIGIGQDITERKRAEEVLRESEEKWRSLVSILPDYVSLLDREDRFLFLNRYAEGFTEKEIIGSSVYQYLSTQSKEIFEKEIAECQNTGKIRKFEHTAMGDHGIMREYEDYLVPLLEKNKVTSTLVISRDITERKQAELLILIQRDLALAISSSHQIDEALSQCLDTIIQLSEMDCGGIYLIDQASGDLNLSCHRNLSPTFIKSVSHYKADSTHARLVLQGKPLFIRYSELDLSLNQDELAEGLRAFAVLPLIFENRVIGCLNLASKKLEEVSEINREVLKVAATLMGEGITRLKIEEELKLSNQKLQKAMKSTIQAIALILEKRDPYNSGHQKRMTKLACAIAEEISLPKDKIEGLYIAGIIHDIGKINVPTEILSKPGRLSEIEFSLIQTHPQVGSDLLKEMELPGEVSSIVLQHHERMDGSGYPSGLSGEAILLEARILAVTDVVEAMASNRPYRPALGLDQALEEITKNKGKLYDPEVVDACWKLFKEKGFKFE